MQMLISVLQLPTVIFAASNLHTLRPIRPAGMHMNPMGFD